MDPVRLLAPPAAAARLSLPEPARDGDVLQENRKVQAAKDFESLLIGKLVDSMKETVGQSGLLEEEGSEQMTALFWMHLATALSEQGGIGLWKDIYRNIYGSEPGELRPVGQQSQSRIDAEL
jgi:Rod binding domain-containing protein